MRNRGTQLCECLKIFMQQQTDAPLSEDAYDIVGVCVCVCGHVHSPGREVDETKHTHKHTHTYGSESARQSHI